MAHKYALIIRLTYDKKLQRWLQLLALLEESLILSGKEIAQELATTRRTLITDVSELNDQFARTMKISGDEHGYRLCLFNPNQYYQKKSQLLEKEPLFFLVKGILFGKQQPTKAWTQSLGVNVTTFHRCKKQLTHCLEHYQLRLTKNGPIAILGEEINIRRFYYDLYYETQFLPPVLSDSQKILEKKMWDRPIHCPWQLNGPKRKGWQAISQQRQRTGQKLTQNSLGSINKIIVKDKESCTLLKDWAKEPEAITLFLFCLEESSFLDFHLQQQFVETFEVTALQAALLDWQQLQPAFRQNQVDRSTVVFLGTWVYLMDQCHLLATLSETEKMLPDFQKVQHFFSPNGRRYLSYLLWQWQQKKQQLRFKIQVKWQLEGPSALQQWIQASFVALATSQGIGINQEAEDNLETTYLPKVLVANQPVEKSVGSYILSLKKIPEESEIEQCCQMLKSQLIRRYTVYRKD